MADNPFNLCRHLSSSTTATAASDDMAADIDTTTSTTGIDRLTSELYRQISDAEEEAKQYDLEAYCYREDGASSGSNNYNDNNNMEEDIDSVDDEDNMESDMDSESGDNHISDDEYSYYDEEENLSDNEDEDDDGGDQLNEETLHKIKDNSPDITSLTVRRFPNQLFAENAGIYIGQNTNLKKLVIKGGNMSWEGPQKVQESHVKFSNGITCNRSIEHLSIQECSLDNNNNSERSSSISTLPLFIEHNIQLHTLEIIGCDIGVNTHLLAAALSRRLPVRSFRRISLDANRISDEAGSELVHALVGHKDSLEYLSLGDNEIGVEGCKALSKLLTTTTTNKLTSLNLENNLICDNAIATLTMALCKNTTLKELNLSFNTAITQAGWQIFSTYLQGEESMLEKLNLSSTNIANEGISALGDAMISNTTLNTLDLYDINNNGEPLITYTGWDAFFICLRNNPSSALKQIDLRYSSIDEESLHGLANALGSQCSAITILDMSQNLHISASAWTSFFNRLGSSNHRFALHDLYLQGNNITDEVIPQLIRALANNNTLKTLVLGDLFPITNSGWEQFRHLLCDKSSITKIRSSNHTLRSLGCEDIPEHIQTLLSLNESDSKKEVAREKILRYHFNNGRDTMNEFVDMELSVLPHVISWVGRNNVGQTLMYQLLQSLPSLTMTCDHPSKLLNKTLAGGKRKRKK